MKSKYWLTDWQNAHLWNRARVGGKAFHLSELTRWGFNVPSFGAITTDCFHYWRQHGSFPEGLMAEVTRDVNAFASHGQEDYFAVRSSMTKEDGDAASFAGILESYLFIKAEEVPAKIIECFESIYSDRAKLYLKEQGIASEDASIGVAVVVQKMIASQVSGVAFSRSPSIHSALVYLEAGLGLGEGIVSGLVEVDSYWLDRFGREWSRTVRAKKGRVLYHPQSHAVQLVEFEDEKTSRAALTEEQAQKLADQVLRIEEKMAKPADVEWAIDAKGELFILQARAITQEFKPIEVYLDTNLAESYPGIVSPMTADFVPKMYTKVIREGMEYLGLGAPNLALLHSALNRLVEEKGGHLYYHLSSYYSVLIALPGGKKNVAGWHQMIGGRSFGGNTQPRVKLKGWRKILVHLNLAKLVFFHNRIFGRFIRQSFTQLDGLYAELNHCQSSRETAQFTTRVIRDVKGWGLTVLNDFLVIIGLKLLTKILGKYHIGETEIPGLLKTEGGVDSMETLHRLSAVARACAAREGFQAKVEAILASEVHPTELEHAYVLLQAAGYEKEVELLQAYLEQFGERSFDELKIECMTFKQSPREFLQFLLWKMRTGEGSTVNVKKSSAPLEVLSRVNGMWDRWILAWALGMTRRAVQARESTRLMRGRYYGLIRSCVLQLGRQLRREAPEMFGGYRLKDFFALDLDWIARYAQAQGDRVGLQAKLEKDRDWESRAVEYPEYYAESAADRTPYFLELIHQQVHSPVEGSLSGMGASGGQVRGQVLVLSDPRDAMKVPSLKDKILVTRSTDPGWIFIMSQCAGLVSEKGSLLSHTAIVGRELGIPTVVGVTNATQILQQDEWIQIDGESGTIERV